MACTEGNSKTSRANGLGDCGDVIFGGIGLGNEGNKNIISDGITGVKGLLNGSAKDALCKYGSDVSTIKENAQKLKDVIDTTLSKSTASSPEALYAKAKAKINETSVKELSSNLLDKGTQVAMDIKDRAYAVGKKALKGVEQQLDATINAAQDLYDEAAAAYATAKDNATAAYNEWRDTSDQVDALTAQLAQQQAEYSAAEDDLIDLQLNDPFNTSAITNAQNVVAGLSNDIASTEADLAEAQSDLADNLAAEEEARLAEEEARLAEEAAKEEASKSDSGTDILAKEAIEVGGDSNGDIKTNLESQMEDDSDTRSDAAKISKASNTLTAGSTPEGAASNTANAAIEQKKEGIKWGAKLGMLATTVTDATIKGICEVGNDAAWSNGLFQGGEGTPGDGLADKLSVLLKQVDKLSVASIKALEDFETGLHSEFQDELGCLSAISDIAQNGIPTDLCEVTQWLDREIECFGVEFPELPQLSLPTTVSNGVGILAALTAFLDGLKICDGNKENDNGKVLDKFIENITTSNNSWIEFYDRSIDEWNNYLDALGDLDPIHWHSPQGIDARANARNYGEGLAALCAEYNTEFKQKVLDLENIFEHDLLPKSKVIIVPRKFRLGNTATGLKYDKVKYYTYGDVIGSDLLYPNSVVAVKCDTFLR